MFSRSSERPNERLERRSFLEGIAALVVGSAVGLTTASNGRADDSDFRVVVHPDNPNRSVDRRFLADAFLKDVSRWDGGEPIRPIDLRADSPVRARFSEKVIRRSVAAVRSYWQQRIFSGRALPPPEADSDEAVVHYVQTNPGSVGYVSAKADIGKVKLLVVTFD